jgi:hypothetical protein
LVLKSGTGNKKLGGKVTKGRYRGMPLYTLTLEEGATCWSGCQNLNRCYGANMPFAIRYNPGPTLEAAIAQDVATLADKHPDGFVVRLHVLGDFYSVDYVKHWAALLDQYHNVYLFGYTHWRAGSDIGDAVTTLVAGFPERAAFLRSDPTETGDLLPGAYTVDHDGRKDLHTLNRPGTVVCPHETGRVASCGACGLCMNGTTGITFIDHGPEQIRKRKVA